MTNKEKILVVRVGRAGDMVMITPALNALFALYPHAEFHLLTRPEGTRVLAGYHPNLTRMWLYDRRFFQNLVQKPKLSKDLRAQNYSRIFIFETNPHYRPFLEAMAPDVYQIEETTSARHFCDICLDLVQSATAEPIERGWIRLPVSAVGIEKARELLAENGVKPDDILVGMHCTFSGSSVSALRDRKGRRHRLWPPESFAALARCIHERAQEKKLPVRIVIDVLPDERTLVEPVVRMSGGVVTLLSGPPDFERYKGMMRLLDVLVTANSGPMHIVSAVGTRVIALFSSWTPDDCGPFVPNDRYRIIQAEDDGKGKSGLAAIRPETVADTVFDMLSGGKDHGDQPS